MNGQLCTTYIRKGTHYYNMDRVSATVLNFQMNPFFAALFQQPVITGLKLTYVFNNDTWVISTRKIKHKFVISVALYISFLDHLNNSP